MTVPDRAQAYTATELGPPSRTVPRLALRHTTTMPRAGKPGRGSLAVGRHFQHTVGTKGVGPCGLSGGLGRLCHQCNLWRNCKEVLLPQFLDRAPG